MAKAAPKLTDKKAACPQCGGERKCDIRGSYQHNYDDADGLFWGRTEWFILQCRGCEVVFIQTVSTDSEHIDYTYRPDGSAEYDAIAEETIEYWPVISNRKLPDWTRSFRGLPVPAAQNLRAALRELYVASDNDLAILTAIGVRTAFDVACEALNIDPNMSFSQKTEALVTQHHIDARDKERLDTMVDAGSAAAHRGWIPDPPHLVTMIDELEKFLHVAFVEPAERARLDREAAEVKAAVPPRRKTVSKIAERGVDPSPSASHDANADETPNQKSKGLEASEHPKAVNKSVPDAIRTAGKKS